jgi:hypothetical protein
MPACIQRGSLERPMLRRTDRMAASYHKQRELHKLEIILLVQKRSDYQCSREGDAAHRFRPDYG